MKVKNYEISVYNGSDEAKMFQLFGYARNYELPNLGNDADIIVSCKVGPENNQTDLDYALLLTETAREPIRMKSISASQIIQVLVARMQVIGGPDETGRRIYQPMATETAGLIGNQERMIGLIMPKENLIITIVAHA